jgi:hypothetical protein
MTKRGMNQLERRRAASTAAMPEVKKIVKRFGRAAVGNCLNKIVEWEREQKKLSKLRSEVAQLERRLKT